MYISNILGNEFQSEIECGTNEYKKTLGMCIRLNKTITIYICPSTTTYKNRRENKKVMRHLEAVWHLFEEIR